MFSGIEPLHGDDELADRVWNIEKFLFEDLNFVFQIIQLLFNCLVSHQDLSISDASLVINITLLSVGHARERQARAALQIKRKKKRMNLNDKFGAPGRYDLSQGSLKRLQLRVPDLDGRPLCLIFAYTLSLLGRL